MLWCLLEVVRMDERHWPGHPAAHSGGQFRRRYTQKRRSCRLPCTAGRSTCPPSFGAMIGHQPKLESMSVGSRGISQNAISECVLLPLHASLPKTLTRANTWAEDTECCLLGARKICYELRTWPFSHS